MLKAHKGRQASKPLPPFSSVLVLSPDEGCCFFDGPLYTPYNYNPFCTLWDVGHKAASRSESGLGRRGPVESEYGNGREKLRAPSGSFLDLVQ